MKPDKPASSRKIRAWVVQVFSALLVPTMVISVAGYLGKSYLDTKLEQTVEHLKVELAMEMSNALYRLEIYRDLGDALFEVRSAGKTVQYYLTRDPVPNFQEKIVAASNRLRDTGDNLQRFLGKNRAFLPEDLFTLGAALVSAVADLIDTLNNAMVSAADGDNLQQALDDFFKKLEQVESTSAFFVQKVIPKPEK